MDNLSFYYLKFVIFFLREMDCFIFNECNNNIFSFSRCKIMYIKNDLEFVE